MTDRTTGPDIEGLTFIAHLGSGGYSDVYQYEQRRPKLKVAVKVLTTVGLTDAELEQFAAEAETMAELADHPYIVRVLWTGTTADGRPFLVMNYYPPPNLGVRAGRERFSVADVLQIGIKIASAVETAHRAGILHRDIKPANILVNSYGEPGLADFGIAGHAADTDDDNDLGVSIPWSPPEVLSGDSNGSVAADIYSLTATIWNLLAGRSPFEVPGGDNSSRALMGRILRNVAPNTGRGDVPASLERLLQAGMSKHVRNRPASALEFARSLQMVEQELRYKRTEIVVDGDAQTTRPHEHGNEPGPDVAEPPESPHPTQPDVSSAFAPAPAMAPPPATAPPEPRIRPATSPALQTTMRPVRPQQPAPATPAPPPQPEHASANHTTPTGTAPPRTPRHEAQPETSRRPAKPETTRRPATPQTSRRPTTPDTTRRAATPGADQPAGHSERSDTPADPPARARGVSRRAGFGIAAALIVATVAVSAVVLSGGGKSPASVPPVTPAATDANLNDGLAPPTVSSHYNPATKRLTFTWEEKNGTTTPEFVYQLTIDHTPVRTSASTVQVVTTHPASVCIDVAVLTATGNLVRADTACG